MLRTIFIAFVGWLVLASGVVAGTLERIRDNGVFKIGYREDTPPFSYKNSIGERTGYSLDLCRAVAAHVKKELGLAKMSVEYVSVTAENRFKAVQSGRVDLLCGATTATLDRRELVDFSVPTFVDGASVLECYRRNSTIVPQQALALSNSVLIRGQARVIAGRRADGEEHRDHEHGEGDSGSDHGCTHGCLRWGPGRNVPGGVRAGPR